MKKMLTIIMLLGMICVMNVAFAGPVSREVRKIVPLQS